MKQKDLYEAVAREYQVPLILVVKIIKKYKKIRHAAAKADYESTIAEETTRLAHDIIDGSLS
ncbi:hypothetical protein P0D71_00345 [Paraburkholderia sp. RL17-383-BIF-A]|uniref:hypothetical protein n=1 Tax=Paraburkholderia sp. RL17-383-BIF-A TaxID=3031631 RepID=UPI0038B870BE